MKKIGLIFSLLLLSTLSCSYADVEKITNYSMDIKIDNGQTTVKNIFAIKNLASYPLVPGIGELRLQERGPKKLFIIPIPFTKEVKSIDISHLEGYYKIGDGKLTPMNVYIKNSSSDFTTICYEIWEPIDKYSNVTVILEYNADIVDDGILFKTVSLPVGCDMDIDNLNIKFNSPYHLTYQEPDGNNFRVPKNTLHIIKAEFSILPLPKLPTYGYVLFWLTVLAILVIILVYTELRSNRKKENE
ncbi:hypothetical protein [Methanococcus aeolicus]|uniref:Uncharacterized protein n=1 Tax=Methanococcus aeolicus (strain ATCC BAA-1280 / DSM 17508 / OCM 812 / Nankai-3) TaxID=419665 RepID=A6UVX1_META3|nr:hypothetical protein [Methanococcus aeolicus]ABR56643.1 hypothetical protein Maeo_1065 [Methanococcus aeolicus Nankai-3]UXM84645.1 hypothetical protein N6C89_07885 [Methanococcus aeolicus]